MFILLFILLSYYTYCDHSFSKVKEKTILKLTRVDIVRVFRNCICTVTHFLLKCPLNRLKSSWQNLAGRNEFSGPPFGGWPSPHSDRQSLCCGYRFGAFKLRSQQMAAAVICTRTHLGTPSPTPAGEAGLCLLFQLSQERESFANWWPMFSAQKLLLSTASGLCSFFKLEYTREVEDENHRPLNLGEMRKTAAPRAASVPFCSVGKLIFVLWGSSSLPLTVHHILLKIIITSLMWI